MSGSQWLIVLGSSLPVAAFCAVAHDESVRRRRAAIDLALGYEELERDTRPDAVDRTASRPSSPFMPPWSRGPGGAT